MCCDHNMYVRAYRCGFSVPAVQIYTKFDLYEGETYTPTLFMQMALYKRV